MAFHLHYQSILEMSSRENIFEMDEAESFPQIARLAKLLMLNGFLKLFFDQHTSILKLNSYCRRIRNERFLQMFIIHTAS